MNQEILAALDNAAELRAENNEHLDCIQELTEALGKERKFRAAFEVLILAVNDAAKHRCTPGDTRGDMLYSTTVNGTVIVWNALKAQHLEGSE